MTGIIDLLREPMLDGVDVDSPERMAIHRAVLEQKPVLKHVFSEFHHEMMRLDERFLSGDGARVELGAGVSPMRDSYPDVMATDIVSSEQLDAVVDAQDMYFDDCSVRAFYGQNCFHHFPDPNAFFSELHRTLIPGGGAILIEPYYGPVASFVFKRLFSTEDFDKRFPSWQVPVSGPMNGANQALSYVVFIRDREQFKANFPGLEIVCSKPLSNYPRYLLSGGLNFRSLIPAFMEKPIKLLEILLRPLSKWMALHHVVVLRRVNAD